MKVDSGYFVVLCRYVELDYAHFITDFEGQFFFSKIIGRYMEQVVPSKNP